MGSIDIAPRWRSLVADILSLHAPRPCRVWAFGSRVRGKARRFSDLDLAVDAGRPLTLGDAAALADAFDESDLPWRVDVVDLVTCSPAFRREVESHAVPFLAWPADPDFRACQAVVEAKLQLKPVNRLAF